MPKEYVIPEAEKRRTDEHGGDMEVVRIGWDNGVQPQIATVLMHNIDGHHGLGDVDDAGGGRRVDEGHFVNLDRAAINKLIRTLRRARDAAFGADE